MRGGYSILGQGKPQGLGGLLAKGLKPKPFGKSIQVLPTEPTSVGKISLFDHMFSICLPHIPNFKPIRCYLLGSHL